MCKSEPDFLTARTRFSINDVQPPSAADADVKYVGLKDAERYRPAYR
jgi:hypothetical protein